MEPVSNQPCGQDVVNYAASSCAAEEVAQKIKEMGGDALIIKANVGKREEIDAMFKEVTEKWGRIDVLVNNAGEKSVRKGTTGVLLVFFAPANVHFIIHLSFQALLVTRCSCA